MALEGPLKEFHIQDVFQLLDLGRKTGVLRVTSELRQTSASVTFDRGGVVAATLGRNPQRFGARLVRTSKISAKDLDRALALQEKGDSRRLGDILVSLGAITRRELDRQLKTQIEETILELLGWTEGHFRFEEGAVSEALVELPLRIPTEGLLMESARRVDEWSRMEDKVPHLRVVPKLPPPESPANGKLDLVPFEWEVLAAVDGQRDLHALADLLGKSEFDVARTIYTLAAAGVVVLDAGAAGENGRDHGTPLAPVRDDIRTLTTRLADEPSSLAFLELGEALRRRGQLDAAYKVTRGGLARYPALADAHDLLGRILGDQGDLAGAFDSWAEALRLDPMRIGALKGIAFLYFRAGDVPAALEHLGRAAEVEPDDPAIVQAIERVRGSTRPAASRDTSPAPMTPDLTTAEPPPAIEPV